MKICIVGNSKDLLNQEFGEKIDSHDIIIRVNNFSIKGFERHVGTKTHIVSCAFGTKMYERQTQDTKDLLKTCNVWLVQQGNERLLRMKNIGIDSDRISIINKETYDALSRDAYAKWWRKLPSTGLTTIVMSLDIFKDEKISIVGFDKKIRKCHYYNDEVDEGLPADGHDWKSEIEYIDSLEKSGKIKRLD